MTGLTQPFGAGDVIVAETWTTRRVAPVLGEPLGLACESAPRRAGRGDIFNLQTV